MPSLRRRPILDRILNAKEDKTGPNRRNPEKQKERDSLLREAAEAKARLEGFKEGVAWALAGPKPASTTRVEPHGTNPPNAVPGAKIARREGPAAGARRKDARPRTAGEKSGEHAEQAGSIEREQDAADSRRPARSGARE